MTCREKYAGGPTNSVTRKELGALFDVTGTPSWRDVEGVQSATWRNYLQKLPGRAPTLYRRLGFAGTQSWPDESAHILFLPGFLPMLVSTHAPRSLLYSQGPGVVSGAASCTGFGSDSSGSILKSS